MSAPKFDNGHALLIGIQYRQYHPDHQLRGALPDVRDVENLLTDPYKAAYPKEQVKSLKEEQATTANILQALDHLATISKENPEATIIIQFAGHCEVMNDTCFWVPYDFNIEAYRNKELDKTTIVSSQQLAKKVANIQSNKLLIILDCCHSASMSETTRSLEGAFLSAVPPSSVGQLLNDVMPDGKIVSETVEKLEVVEATTTRGGLVSKIEEGTGRIILTACGEDEKAIDSGTNGLFTQALLEVLGGEGNHEKDGYVDIWDIQRYLTKVVPARARQKNHEQHPVFKTDKHEGRFIVCAYDIYKTRGLENPTMDQ